jgi:hypothetical protein
MSAPVGANNPEDNLLIKPTNVSSGLFALRSAIAATEGRISRSVASNIRIERLLRLIRPYLRACGDLLSGLFPLSTKDAPNDCDYAADIEHRYSSPRRCC